MSQHEPHERLARHEVKIGSERKLGIVFAIVFAVIGSWPLLRGSEPHWWSIALAAGFLAAGMLQPDILKPLNRLWFKFGLLLSKITTPIVMGLLFFITVVPTALVMRLRGKDLLHMRLDRDARSYWIVRTARARPRYHEESILIAPLAILT